MRYVSGIQTFIKAFIAITSTAIAFVILAMNPVDAEDVPTDFLFFNDSDPSVAGDFEAETMGCETNVSANYIGGFEPQQFEWVNMEVDERGFMTLNSPRLNSLPDKVLIPFEQEVYATFISVAADVIPDLGWMLYADAVDENGHFHGWDTIDESNKHLIFRHLVDNEVTDDCCATGNGILDSGYGLGDFPTDSETALVAYDDGSAIHFFTDRDGNVTPRDMKKRLGRFAADSEIVFYLNVDRPHGTLEEPQIYFNKPWSRDVYGACTPDDGSPLWIDRANGNFNKRFHLGEPAESESCHAETNWLANPVLDRLDSAFDLQPFGDYNLPVIFGDRFSHMIGGVSERNTNHRVYGFEFGEPNAGEPDMDFSDVVFLVERPNGGAAALSPSRAIRPAESDAFFTAVDLEVCDYRPAGGCTGQTSLTYFISTDQGASWIAVNRWDNARFFSLNTKEEIIHGQEFDPASLEVDDQEYTCRKRRIDLIESGHTGDNLLWKVEMMSARHDCSPKVQGVRINAAATSNRVLPAAAPVVQANLVYTGWVETPATEWKDHSIRGHLSAREIYNPVEPNQTLREKHILWDAGEVLANSDPDERTIFFPGVEIRRIVNEHLVDDSGREINGDGIQTYFKGSLSLHPVLATSVSIFDGRPEIFSDRKFSALMGSYGGMGKIDHAAGKWEVRFSQPPAAGVPIMADYTWYSYRGSKKSFIPGEVTNEMLGLSDEYVWPVGYTYDLNRDGWFDTSKRQTDADWLVQWTRGYYRPQEGLINDWQMNGTGPSGPALLVPPGYPRWLLGTAVTENERQSYIEFRDAQKDRDSVLFVGSGGGLLHALDAGKYRYGDNPDTPAIRENRGYFAWEPKKDDSPRYCANFSGSRCPNYGTGSEIWAFISASVLPHLKYNALRKANRFSVDISPVLSDVFMDTDGDGLGDAWRTVLVCTVGNPARSVFCLDVTDPHEPLFLWERSAADLDRDGLSPAMARIGRIRHPLNGEAIWVAFYATGRTAENHNYPAVDLLEISTGSQIQTVSLDGAVDLNGDGHLNESETSYGRGGVLSGQPALVDSDSNGLIDRVYLAASRGLIYKINIPDDDQDAEMRFTSCVINTDFTDPKNGTIPLNSRWRPIYASPTVVVDPDIDENGVTLPLVRVFVGTGDNPYQGDDIENGMNRDYFLAYVDTNTKGACEQDGHQLDWFVELEEGHRVSSAAFAAADRIYFGTTVSDLLNSCTAFGSPQGEQGKLYVFELDGVEIISGRIGDLRFDPLVTDEHLYLMTSTGLKSIGSGVYNNQFKSASEPLVTLRAWEEVK